MKYINAFKNLIAVNVISGDCKLVVNGFIAKQVSKYEIVVDMVDSTTGGYDTRCLKLGALMNVTLLPDNTKFRCVFANRYLPERPDIVEIEVMKIMNFKSWIFVIDKD